MFLAQEGNGWKRNFKMKEKIVKILRTILSQKISQWFIPACSACQLDNLILPRKPEVCSITTTTSRISPLTPCYRWIVVSRQRKPDVRPLLQNTRRQARPQHRATISIDYKEDPKLKKNFLKNKTQNGTFLELRKKSVLDYRASLLIGQLFRGSSEQRVLTGVVRP